MSRIETNTDVESTSSPTKPLGRKLLMDIEVATRLGVSPFTLRAWRLKGHGPKFLKMGRAVRYRPQDVDEYERQALVETRVNTDRHSA